MKKWNRGIGGEKKEYCLIGLNKFNLEVGKLLVADGHKVTVLDKESKKINNFGDDFDQAIVCDATNPKELKNIGIVNFDYVVIGITDVGISIATAANLKELDVKNVMCKAKDESHRKILRSLGVKVSYIPEEEIAAKVAYKLIHDLNVDSFSIYGDDQETFVVKIPLKNSELWGVQIKDATVIKSLAATVISLERSNGAKVVPVSGTDYFREGDIVCLICNKKDLLRIRSSLS